VACGTDHVWAREGTPSLSRSSRSRACTLLTGAVVIVTGQSVPTATGAATRRLCDHVAAVTGVDSAPGTLTRPYRTVRHLLAQLRPGQTGCLLGGVFVENVRFVHGGRRRDRLTLRGAPGVRASIHGYLWVTSAANDVTIEDLSIDGHDVEPPTVQVQGDRVTLSHVTITNRNKSSGTRLAKPSYHAMCVLAGADFEADPRNTAWDLTIATARIHNCGDDAHEHAIYLESTRRARVTDSYLYDNPGYGVQMYPDAQGSLIEHDVIDGNSSDCKANLTFSGEIAGGEYSRPHGSSNNIVRLSLITNSLCRYNVDSYYPPGSLRPSANIVERSCVWNAPLGNFGGGSGYTQRDNINKNPLYRDRARSDFRLRPGSPCSGLGPAAIQPAKTSGATAVHRRRPI